MESVNAYCQEFPCLVVNSKQVYCSCCEKNLTSKVSNIEKHLKTKSHLEREGEKKTQYVFNMDLTNFMIASNIPWKQLENKNFVDFLKKCIGGNYANTVNIPSESNLRLRYLPKKYDETFTSIRQDIGNSYIYVSVDETKDQTQRNVANVIVGALKGTNSSRPHIIACQVLERTNNETIKDLIVNSLKNLFQNDNYHERVALLLTDGAAYMIKAGRTLNSLFPNMTHVTCVAHGLNRVAETVRGLFDDVNELISSIKSVFLKSPSRVRVLKQLYPDMPKPPRPIITRWNTWIEACMYYRKYLEEITNVINALNERTAVKVRRAKLAIKKPNLRQNIFFITENCTVLVESTQHMQNSNLLLTESLDVIKTVTAKLSKICLHEKGKDIYRKHILVLMKNKGLRTMEKIAALNDNKEICLNETTEKMDLWPFLKYAPITSVEVERSFSILKWIFSSTRCNLTPRNIEQILIINYESKFNNVRNN